MIKMIISGILVLMAMSMPLRAQPAEKFLKSLSGTWRGSGNVYVSKKSPNSPVRCRITSTLDETKRQLRNKGRCATAQQKAKLTGAISYSANGSEISGSYFNSIGDITITKSEGTIKGRRLVLSTIFEDRAANKISRARSIIQLDSNKKFTITLFEKVGDTYQRRGVITFVK